MGLECRRPRYHPAAGIDEGRNARVGGPQQVSRRLRGPDPGDLQVLVRRHRIAEPGVVADVDQQRGLGQVVPLLGAEQILVADAHADPLPGDVQRRLIGIARHGIGVRQAHQPEPPAHEARHRKVLPVGHQVPLDVEGRFLVQNDQGVLKRAPARIVPQDAQRHLAAARPGPVADLTEVAFSLRVQRGNGRLRPDDEPAVPGLFGEAAVEIQGGGQLLRKPLQLLGHGPLHQRCRDHVAGRLAPAEIAQKVSAPPHQRESQH